MPYRLAKNAHSNVLLFIVFGDSIYLQSFPLESQEKTKKRVTKKHETIKRERKGRGGGTNSNMIKSVLLKKIEITKKIIREREKEGLLTHLKRMKSSLIRER